MEWLSRIDMEGVHDTIFREKHTGTAEWLFQDSAFIKWVDARQSTLLWCFGGRRLSLILLPGDKSVELANHCCSWNWEICARVRHLIYGKLQPY